MKGETKRKANTRGKTAASDNMLTESADHSSWKSEATVMILRLTLRGSVGGQPSSMSSYPSRTRARHGLRRTHVHPTKAKTTKMRNTSGAPTINALTILSSTILNLLQLLSLQSLDPAGPLLVSSKLWENVQVSRLCNSLRSVTDRCLPSNGQVS